MMKQKTIHLSRWLWLLLLLPLLADQPSSSNFTLTGNAFTAGNPNQADPPGSPGYIAAGQSLGGISDNEVTSASFDHQPGFLVPMGGLIYGCTEPTAYNYNPDANVDDGSCEPCVLGDVNGENGIDVIDIVLLVSVILLETPMTDAIMCAGDIDGENGINVVDLVALVDIILNSRGNRGQPISEVQLALGDQRLIIDSNGTLAGIQLAVQGKFQLETASLPAGWEIACSHETILAFDREHLTSADQLQLSWKGDLQILEGLATDWYQSSVSLDIGQLPAAYSLSAPWPNPFNPVTNIEFSLPVDGQVSIEVFDLNGHAVEIIEQDQLRSAGRHQVQWSAEGIPSGIYLIRLETGGFQAVRKAVLLK